MGISIIIPTYNAERYLPELLRMIKNQSLKAHEIIIIDSSSKDKTVEIARQYTENIMVIPQNEFNHGGTRTQASRMAKGEVLIFFTQDALPYNEITIEKIVEAFDDKKVGAAYGRQISYKDTNLFGRHLRKFNYPDQTIIKNRDDIKRYGIKTPFLSNSFARLRQ